MTTFTIKNLPDLVGKYLEPNEEISDIDITKLSKAGFGSIMLKVDIKLKFTDGSEKYKHLVAKLLPPSPEVLKHFNMQVTYKKEVAFYDTVVPTLRNFQKENEIEDCLNMFPKFYGARINLDEGSDKVTDDAVFLLENLLEAGYDNLKRGDTFNLEISKAILKDLAKWHGTGIGVKLKRPKIFEEKIKAVCSPFNFKDQIGQTLVSFASSIAEENPKTAPFVETIRSFMKRNAPRPTGPYATITHNDMCISNTMQKIENGKTKNMFVDFQMLDYRSCASDVFFFLWTSVQQSLLETQLDDLISYYHEQLISTLEELNCDTTTFSIDSFYDEIKEEAYYEFGHTFMFTSVTRNPMMKSGSPDKNEKPEGPPSVPVALKEFMWFMIEECHKRGWLY